MTQGAPSYSRNVTASIGSRFIRIGAVLDTVSSTIDPNLSSTIFSNPYQTYNALTCTGGWGQGGDAQPVAGTTVNNGNNYAECPWWVFSSVAWGVELVDLLP
jgi:hypothetical protein